MYLCGSITIVDKKKQFLVNENMHMKVTPTDNKYMYSLSKYSTNLTIELPFLLMKMVHIK